MPLKEVLADVARWQAAGERAAIARVVGVVGSSPREAGAAMAVSQSSEVAGSVSGGCVEGAVVEAALEILGGEREPGVITFGYSDEDAFAVGLTCGGTIHLFVEPVEEQLADGAIYSMLDAATSASEPVALVTVVGGVGVGAKLLVRPGAAPVGTLGDPDLDRVVSRDALGELEAGLSSTRHYGEHGEAREEAVSVFIESFVVPPRMIIFGAVDFTAALASVAKLLGFRVIVCDARAVFATVLRFPMADEVVNLWPDKYLGEVGGGLTERDVVCVLTHDHKFDVPAIVAATQTKVGYIGAMGSRRTNEGRVVRLREVGLTDDQIGRVMSPIGLDIGARTPEETAISICAEVIASRTGRRAGSLRDTGGPIH
jgi:xanthine dehydrogenase accessory factor